VGASSGSWLTAGIEAQAADLVAELAAARSVLGDVPTGLFGHSQGGWVVLEASTVANPDFIITNSGPAVSPREQEIYSTEQTLRKRGWDDEAVRAGLASFHRVMDLLDLPYGEAWPKASALPLIDELTAVGAFIPTDPELWSFASAIIDYDPVPALRALDVPLLALLGEEDDVVPVQRSADVFHTTVPPDLLHLRVLSAATIVSRRTASSSTDTSTRSQSSSQRVSGTDTDELRRTTGQLCGRVNRLTRFPSGSRNRVDRLPHGIVVGSSTTSSSSSRSRANSLSTSSTRNSMMTELLLPGCGACCPSIATVSELPIASAPALVRNSANTGAGRAAAMPVTSP
jgi:hypothetical protein